MQIQSEFARSDWSGAATVPLEAFVVQVARASKASWATMFNVIADAYDAHWNGVVCGNLRASVWNVVLAQQIDHPMCWNTNAAVKAQVGQSLRQAQDVTAQYLAMVGGLD